MSGNFSAADFQCSQLSRARGEPLSATGSVVRGWLAIEVPGAWGPRAVTDSALGQAVPVDFEPALRRRGLRALVVRPILRIDQRPLTMFASIVRRPEEGPPQLWRRTFSGLHEVADITRELRIDDLGIGAAPGPEWRRSETTFFICTNGRHDQCCAIEARPVIRRLRESPWRGRVWECSHIGGDRFAPNLLALPQSLYFGRFSEADLDELLTGVEAGRIDLRYFRGRTSFRPVEQQIEHTIREHLGDLPADAVHITGLGRGSFEVAAAEQRLVVQVRRVRDTIAEPLTCKGSAGQVVDRFVVTSIVSMLEQRARPRAD